MKRIAKFHKVSEKQFAEGWRDSFGAASEEEIQKIYENIRLPKRATAGSAGYDFFSPLDFELKPGETIKIPTWNPGWNGVRLGAEDLSQKRSGL